MRTVHCEDAIHWLQNCGVLTGSSLIASLPDISEFPSYSLSAWKEWFQDAARLVFKATPDDGVTVFYQSDIKYEGHWVDKGYLCQKVGEELGIKLLWHKIMCRAPAGSTTFGRPSYTHILCFSKNLSLDVSRSTPDVLPEAGDKTWERGMGLNACLMIAKYIKDQTPSSQLVHPFCGQGAMLASANALGLKAIGIERSPKRAEAAKNLKLSDDLKKFV